jgi:hypothetical protein
MVAAIGAGDAFSKGRDFAARLGLVPKQTPANARTHLQIGASHTFGTHRSKKCRKRLLFGVIYFYQTFKTTCLENIHYGPFGVANLELATVSL